MSSFVWDESAIPDEPESFVDNSTKTSTASTEPNQNPDNHNNPSLIRSSTTPLVSTSTPNNFKRPNLAKTSSSYLYNGNNSSYSPSLTTTNNSYSNQSPPNANLFTPPSPCVLTASAQISNDFPPNSTVSAYPSTPSTPPQISNFKFSPSLTNLRAKKTSMEFPNLNFTNSSESDMSTNHNSNNNTNNVNEKSRVNGDENDSTHKRTPSHFKRPNTQSLSNFKLLNLNNNNNYTNNNYNPTNYSDDPGPSAIKNGSPHLRNNSRNNFASPINYGITTTLNNQTVSNDNTGDDKVTSGKEISLSSKDINDNNNNDNKDKESISSLWKFDEDLFIQLQKLSAKLLPKQKQPQNFSFNQNNTDKPSHSLQINDKQDHQPEQGDNQEKEEDEEEGEEEEEEEEEDDDDDDDFDEIYDANELNGNIPPPPPPPPLPSAISTKKSHNRSKSDALSYSPRNNNNNNNNTNKSDQIPVIMESPRSTIVEAPSGPSPSGSKNNSLKVPLQLGSSSNPPSHTRSSSTSQILTSSRSPSPAPSPRSANSSSKTLTKLDESSTTAVSLPISSDPVPDEASDNSSAPSIEDEYNFLDFESIDFSRDRSRAVLISPQLKAISESSSTPVIQVTTEATSPNPIPQDILSPSALEHRRRIINEVISTEQTYTQHLSTLVTLYLTPLSKGTTVGLSLTPKQIQAIFGNVGMLHQFHTLFLSQLDKIQSATGDSQNGGVGEVILRYADYLKMYTAYLNNYPTALQALDTLRKNSKFQTFLETQKSLFIQQNPKIVYLDIYSLLITPVQRIPRYELLLKELLRHTPSAHSEHSILNEALGKIQTIAVHINAAKGQVENMNILLALQTSMSGADELVLMQPHRRLILEGIVTKVKMKKNFILTEKSVKLRKLFLFNDIALWLTMKKKLLGIIRLDLWTVAPCADMSDRGGKEDNKSSGPSSGAFRLCFNPVRTVHTTTDPGQSDNSNPSEKMHLFVCADTETRDKWIKAFLEQMNALDHIKRDKVT